MEEKLYDNMRRSSGGTQVPGRAGVEMELGEVLGVHRSSPRTWAAVAVALVWTCSFAWVLWYVSSVPRLATWDRIVGASVPLIGGIVATYVTAQWVRRRVEVRKRGLAYRCARGTTSIHWSAVEGLTWSGTRDSLVIAPVPLRIPMGSSFTLTIRTQDGQELRLNSNTSALPEVYTAIEAATIEARVGRTLQRLQKEGAVRFSPQLGAKRDGLQFSGRDIPWGAITGASISGGYLLIQAQGEESLVREELAQVENVDVLTALIRANAQNAGRSTGTT